MTDYTIAKVTDILAALMDGMEPGEAQYAVMRETTTRGVKVWSFHKTEKLAKAAQRRWSAREVVTR